MNAIELHGVTLDYEVKHVRTRSLRRTLANYATGGKLLADRGDNVTVRALDNVSLRVAEGARLGIFGHNGSGKSTLLRVMAGVYVPTRGTVVVNGRVSSALDVSLGMEDEATGRENVLIMALYRGVPLNEARASVDAICDFAGLGPYIDMPVKSYSSGMRLRLAFSVATSWQPDILLLDEWLSTGDEMFVGRAKDRLQSFLSKARALVVASQSRELLSRVCDHVLVLHQGRVAAYGTPDEVWRAYPAPQDAVVTPAVA
ncbi:ABC transporter ATP-binding protein [Brevundimonas sp.]|uniref:ABC transporter ATP-binding protein n=1 Tax=Brevundimonas sp. TaxID=1871086 RepID=UPI0025F2730C|nr:ABC transporter ATP-binding protein [Brevundimonas sp.]